MRTTVTLDQLHFKAVAERARALGKTPATYIESLIDAAALSFDEILEPVREGFAKSGVTAEELDRAVAEARKNVDASPQRKHRK